MKGRKPIPSKIHILQGGGDKTHRNRTTGGVNGDEPRPPEKMPPCPKHLDKAARKEWRRAGRVLQQVGLMTELDMATFAGYCQAYSEWGAATMEVPKKGAVWIDKEGMPRLNPYIRVARDAYDRMMKAAVLLGLSPSSRASLKVKTPAPADPADEFLKRRNQA